MTRAQTWNPFSIRDSWFLFISFFIVYWIDFFCSKDVYKNISTSSIHTVIIKNAVRVCTVIIFAIKLTFPSNCLARIYALGGDGKQDNNTIEIPNSPSISNNKQAAKTMPGKTSCLLTTARHNCQLCSLIAPNRIPAPTTNNPNGKAGWLSMFIESCARSGISNPV